MSEDLDKALARLFATCPCDACERYRKMVKKMAERLAWSLLVGGAL